MASLLTSGFLFTSFPHAGSCRVLFCFLFLLLLLFFPSPLDKETSKSSHWQPAHAWPWGRCGFPGPALLATPAPAHREFSLWEESLVSHYTSHFENGRASPAPPPPATQEVALGESFRAFVIHGSFLYQGQRKCLCGPRSPSEFPPGQSSNLHLALQQQPAASPRFIFL